MDTSGYKEVDHTADLAICVWGEDIFAIMRQAAKGMYSFLNAVPNRDAPVRMAFHIQKDLPEIMLIDFLSELLYLTEEKKIFFDTFNFNDEGDEIAVTAAGYRYKAIRRNLKAVTYHNLELIDHPYGLETTITFDV